MVLSPRLDYSVVSMLILKTKAGCRKALKIFCDTYHFPDEVHPQIATPNQTIHEMPAGKIGVYTSAAKVSHFEILCRVHGFEPTAGYRLNASTTVSKAAQRGEDEPKLLDTTVGRIVPLLPVAPARAQKQLAAIVAGEPSHPAKKLRDDYGAPGGPSVAEGGPVPTLPFVTSSVSVTPEREDEHLADFVTGLNLRTICAPQRFVISLDFSHHSGANIAKAEVDSIARSAAPIIVTVVTATADVATATKEAPAREAPAKPSLFAAGSSSAGGTDPAPGGFSDVSSSDFLVGCMRTVVDPEFDLQKVYVPQWSVTNGSCLDDGRVCREMLDEFAPPNFFASIRGMEHDQLFTEFNVGTARQISLSAEVRMRAEYNIKEKRRLKAVVEEKDMLLKTKGEEIDSLSAQLHLKEAEAAEAIHLRAEASRFGVVEKSLRDEVKYLRERNAALEEEKGILNVKVHALEASSAGLQEKVTAYEKFVDQLEKFQDDKIKEVNDKLEKLDADVVAMVLHLEEKFYPHLLNTIAGRRWLLTHGMELAIAKCLNSTEYLSALGAAIGKAIEKGMQEGLSAGITHGIEGRTLTDIAAYNPSAEADYLAALHHLQSVNFSLLAELKSNKDASTETIMNLLWLEDHLADKVGTDCIRSLGLTH
ncbi:hypothetical protein Tco_1068104 [Tanacetum coccineum]|uniref:Transposase (Putative), gypsy type n=1 Tax=Tanacetum coccineum TaxID=301880 RepID=A0ABQ5HES8_9ASTR